MSYQTLRDVLDPEVQWMFREFVVSAAETCGEHDVEYLARWLSYEYMGTANVLQYASGKALVLGLNLRGFEAATSAWGSLPDLCRIYLPPADDPLYVLIRFAGLVT